MEEFILKGLRKYGDMFTRLNNEIHEDIKTKTGDELKEIENEAKAANLINSGWAEWKVSKIVLGYIFYEKRRRQKG